MKRVRSEDFGNVFMKELQKSTAEHRDFVFEKGIVETVISKHGIDNVATTFLECLRLLKIPCIHKFDSQQNIDNIITQARKTLINILVSKKWTFKNANIEFGENTRLLYCPSTGNQLGNYFSADLRFFEQVSKKNSAQQSWEDDAILLLKIQEMLKDSSKSFTQNRLRSNILVSGNCQYPTSFPVPFVLYILQREAHRRPDKKLRTVLDPCAGWGDRLTGFLLSGSDIAEKYIGIDPWAKSHEACERVLNKLGNPNQKVEIWKQSAQESIWPDDVDLVFTSPPYAELECYDYNGSMDDVNTKKQAWRLCKEGKFMSDFLVPLMEKASKATLKANGRVIININNIDKSKQGTTLTHDLQSAAKMAGLTLVEIMGISTGNRRNSKSDCVNAEPIFIFQH